MTLEQLYSNYSSKSGNARELFTQTHWYSSIAEFDPRTHEAFPQSLSMLLRKIAEQEKLSLTGKPHTLKDRLWRIIVHAQESLTALLRNLNESPFRDHAFLPLRDVRELDTSSFMALSRRPGRNVREKLAGKPYLQAVRRYQSVDLPENSLLKAFAERLAEFLELRVEYLHDQESDELLYQIRSWLTTDEAKSIRRWENLPPNNTLLSHKDYRHVYDSWRWLQSLDDDLENDLKMISARQKTMQQWREYGKMYAESRHLFAEEPVLFDYDNFEIRLWDNQPHFQRATSFSRPKDIDCIDAPVCIDLAEIHPRYSFLTGTAASPIKEFPDTFIWQRWENEESPVPSFDIDLFNADAVFLHPDTTTISAPELFFSKNHTLEHLGFAALTFAKKLREKFQNDILFWLQPDYLNDFELNITRRNINACFPKAEPLPRSVAAVFEKVDYQSIKEGYVVLVTDAVGGKLCATKLEAKFDPDLNKRLPKTNGFYWERQPTIILSNNNSDDNSQIIYDIYSVDEKQTWFHPQKPKTNAVVNQKILQENHIGHFDRILNITESPVCGGVKLFAMQQRAGDIPLWRDQIPELSIKLIVNGRYQRFYLVTRGTTIKPIRGQAVTIPIDQEFTLQAGKRYFQLPLNIGQNEDEMGFSAMLESPAFPLKNDLKCKLNMTFTYGADDPYCLIFEPDDKSIQPIRVKWEKTFEEIITDAPAPDYPKPMTWDDLRRVPKRDGEGTHDLLEWVPRSTVYFDNALYYPPPKRVVGYIIDQWSVDRYDYRYAHAKTDSLDETVFIHEKSFVEGYYYSYYGVGSYISFILHEREGRYSGSRVASSDYQDERKLKNLDELDSDIINRIHKSLYFPIIQIWRDGRSISDNLCPIEFKNAIDNIIVYLNILTDQDAIPDNIKNEIRILLSFMHKDAPPECVQWLCEQVRNNNILDCRTVGFALGDVSAPWQKDIFKELIQHADKDAFRVFAYAIWRYKRFVDLFSYDECLTIINGVLSMLEDITSSFDNKNENTKRSVLKRLRLASALLELLLGMLRTRCSSNEDIKMLLQPHQKITKELAKQVERVEDIIARSNFELRSRIQLGELPPKPKDDKTPDLLYALRLYLTGDTGANAIRITGVVDDSDDD